MKGKAPQFISPKKYVLKLKASCTTTIWFRSPFYWDTLYMPIPLLHLIHFRFTNKGWYEVLFVVLLVDTTIWWCWGQPPGPKYPCGICSKNVGWNGKNIQCDGCDIWYHAKCANIGPDSFKALEPSHVTWICIRCGLPNLSSQHCIDIEELVDKNYFTPLTQSDYNIGTSLSRLKLLTTNTTHLLLSERDRYIVIYQTFRVFQLKHRLRMLVA